MTNFKFAFVFDGHTQDARASEIEMVRGEKQYHCHPVDESLNQIYGTQLIQYYEGKELAYQYGFPDAPQSHEYMHALATGLRAYVFAH